MSSKIVFFGNERLATGVTTTAPVLQALLAAEYEIVAVVSHNEPGNSRQQRDLEIATIAEQHAIPVLLPPKPADIAEQLRHMQPEIGVLVAYGKIVPQSIIDIFPRGIVNIHPSALPKHRGPTPLESVLLAGETETAVTLMSLGAKMDAGPIYAQQQVALSGHETKQQLADQLVTIGKDLLLQYLPAILSGDSPPLPQADEAATYNQLITKQDGVIDWHQPAALIERQIRAYAGWPKSRTDIGGRDVAITAAHVTAGSGTAGVIWLEGRQIGMHTAEGILVIDQLVPAGKKQMSGSDFLLGYKPAL